MGWIIGIIVIIAIIGGITELVSESGIPSKLMISAVIASVACLLLKWITGWGILVTIAKIFAVIAVAILVVLIVKRIFVGE